MDSRLTLRSRLWIACTLAVFWLLLGHAPAAFGYSWSTCDGSRLKWNSARANMYVSTTSFPVSSPWDQRLQNAMWHWNNVKNSSFNFYVGRDTDTTYSHSNRVNEVALGNIDGPGGVLARTSYRRHCYWAPFSGWEFGYDEADVVFDVAERWSTSSLSYSSDGTYSFEGVALHEFGHALGLGHEDRALAVMGTHSLGGTLGYYKEWDPLPDDRQGARYLYGGDGTREIDIAASVFKRTGTSTSGTVTSPATAIRGSTVTFEYTLANQSTSAPSYEVAFYLSSNDYISTGDTRLGSTYVSGGSAGYLVTWSRAIAIPTWILPGTYYLGVLVDPSNTLVESNESNGIQPMPRPITLY